MRSNFVFQEIWVGLRRNLTTTVALIVVVTISLSLLVKLLEARLRRRRS